MKPLKILVSGATGFIGSILCRRLSECHKIIGIGNTQRSLNNSAVEYEFVDLTNINAIEGICSHYLPDVIVHCAGISHQKIRSSEQNDYVAVNSIGTENLAKAAIKYNPSVNFIFLSSVSVYGGYNNGTKKKNINGNFDNFNKNKGKKSQIGIIEGAVCRPTSDYAKSKLEAENRLLRLYDSNKLAQLYILRLAPVYDVGFTSNLIKRVLSPLNITYVRFGSGLQKMSALSRDNLIDFIIFLIKKTTVKLSCGIKSSDQNKVNAKQKPDDVLINVCDSEPYDFNTIITTLKNAGLHTNRPVVSVPLSFVWFLTRTLGPVIPQKTKWIHSWYDHLSSDLVFETKKMSALGFVPGQTIETILKK